MFRFFPAIRMVGASALLVGFLLAPQARAQSTATPQEAGTQSNESIARAFMADLANHDFASADGRFSPQVAGLLPTEKLAQAWQQVISNFGQFESIIAARPNPKDPSVITLTCKFSRATMDAVFPFNDSHQLIGFRIIPSAELGNSSWTAPSYAKSDSFTEQDVTVGASPWALPGTLTMPKGAGPFPALVLVHGSGPNDADESFGPNKMFKDVAWGLATRGVAVLRYEKRTRKYGAQMVAGKDPITVKNEADDDAVAAVALLASTPGVDSKHIFLAGHSLGGYLAPQIAASDPQIAGIILFAGGSRPLEDEVVDQITDQLTKAGELNTPEGQQAIAKAKADKAAIEDPNLKPGVMLGFAGTKVDSDYFLDLRNYDPVKVAQSLRIPILILQGERDYQVTMADFALWKTGLAGHGNVTLKTYPALNHFFFPGSGPATPAEYNVPSHVEPDVIADVANWIRAQSASTRATR
jgi:uncharacterized protein